MTQVAALHDIGKLATPDTILHKTGVLDRAERAIMQAHTIVGGELLRRIPSLAHLELPVRSTHERWDARRLSRRARGDDDPARQPDRVRLRRLRRDDLPSRLPRQHPRRVGGRTRDPALRRDAVLPAQRRGAREPCSPSSGRPRSPPEPAPPPLRGSSASSLAQLPIDFPLRVALADRLALVPDVLAARQGELDLRAGAAEVRSAWGRSSARVPWSCRSAAPSRGDAGAACGRARARGCRATRADRAGCGRCASHSSPSRTSA